MIAKLQRKLTLLVVCVLVLITAGIVLSINYMNWSNITSKAEEALETLAQSSGVRPKLRKPEDSSPEKVEKLSEREEPGLPNRPETSGKDKRTPSPGQPLDSDNTLASLSNYYVVTLSSDGTVKSWSSDRSDLYSDELVADMTSQALASGREFGRFGTQFFRFASQGGTDLLIVLDERLDILNAAGVLRMTLLAAGLACIILCIAAYYLIRYMVRPVQEAFDRQRQFVWDASHELKTPLAVISANADVLSGEIGDNEYLRYIRSEVRRTDELVKNLLTLARMDSGKKEAELKDIDLSKTVLYVSYPLESVAFEAGKHLELNVPDNIHCRGDETMLQQLTVILLSNAIKYSDEGGTISLSLLAKGRSRILQVSNSGEGIAPSDQTHIFERFYRTDSAHSRNVDGNGLGLSIAKNIVEAHHGKIQVKSTPGVETVFTVSLPG